MMRLRIASVSSATGRPEVDQNSEKVEEDTTQTATIAESLQKSSTLETTPIDPPTTEDKERKEPVGWNVPAWSESDVKEKSAIVAKEHRISACSGRMTFETKIEAPALPKKKWYQRIPCF